MEIVSLSFTLSILGGDGLLEAIKGELTLAEINKSI